MATNVDIYQKTSAGVEKLTISGTGGAAPLSSAVNSAAEDVGANSLAVKTAYDKGVAAQTTADGKVSKALDDATGVLPVANGGTGATSASGVRNLVGMPGITQRVSNLEEQFIQGVYLWSPDANYVSPSLTFGPNDSKLYQALSPSGPGVAGVGAKEPGAAGSEEYWLDYAKSITPPAQGTYELCEFYFFRHPTLRPGFQPAQGGLLQNAATLYPEAWAYLQTAEGKKLCTTEEQWQAMTTATWGTLADGSTVGWNGIGGAPYYAPNTATGALRLPDLRGMYAEAAGSDSLDVGGVHGDGMREIFGDFHPRPSVGGGVSVEILSGAFAFVAGGNSWGYCTAASGRANTAQHVSMRASRVAPVANKNAPRAWGALACVYLGKPAS